MRVQGLVLCVTWHRDVLLSRGVAGDEDLGRGCEQGPCTRVDTHEGMRGMCGAGGESSQGRCGGG